MKKTTTLARRLALRMKKVGMGALCLALPLALSSHVLAGAPFGRNTAAAAVDLSAPGAKAPVRQGEVHNGEFLVRFKESVPQARRNAKHAQWGHSKLRELPGSGIHQVRLSPATPMHAALARYAADPDVAYAEPNYTLRALLTPNEPAFNLLWGMANTGQTQGTPGVDIRATTAWNYSTGSSDVVVMVIDSGIDTTHPDLAANLWVNPREIPGNGIDDDANGYVDDVHGIDAINGDSDPMDDYGHGTHVAGTIGAVGNNNLGVVGLNWRVKLLPCKALNHLGQGTAASATVCVDYARALKAQGVNIVATNNSYGEVGGFSQTLFDAINARRDILFVAAAGNSGLDNDINGFNPASYALPNIISVAATDHNDALASFSHYGRRTVHLGAPGVNIWSTVPGSDYASANGTSMATPHVTGLAALLKAQNATRDWRAIKNLILAGALPKPALSGKTLTGARLDAPNAMACSNRPLFSVILGPTTFNHFTASTVSVQSINCASPVGPVTGITSSGQAVTLLDDGVSPDLAAGDGIFSASFSRTTGSYYESHIDFSSAAGFERFQAPDYAIQSVSPPANAIRGQNATFNVTVANLSTSQAWAVPLHIYLSTDIVLNQSDLLVANVMTPVLAPGQQLTMAVTAALPQTLAAGNYYYGAWVDPTSWYTESNEGNNLRSNTTPMSIGLFEPDLYTADLSVPSGALTGAAITLAATVKNQGNAPASATTLYHFLATNPSVSSSYLLLGQSAVASLASGASQRVSGSFTIPATLPAGTYTYVAQADGPNALVETSEANNTAVGKPVVITYPAVDLRITQTTGVVNSVDGKPLTLGATVLNGGTSPSPAATVQWRLSTDTVLSADDITLGSATVSALAGGSSGTVSVSTKVPNTVAPGTYYVIAVVDPGKLVGETNQNNNTGAATPISVSYVYGLKGEYFNTRFVMAPSALVRHEAVNFAWQLSAPAPEVNADNFSVRWTGSLVPSATGSYKFRTLSDDGVRVWLNGALIIDNWTWHTETYNESATLSLTEGQAVDIVVEYFDDNGQATMKLEWWPPKARAWAAVPASNLRVPTLGANAGLKGEYFNTVDLTGTPVLVRNEQVNFDWMANAPTPAITGDTFSARWTGFATATTAGTYVFQTQSDDGVRLWINGAQVINNWTDHSPVTDNSAAITLAAGQKFSIKLEYYDRMAQAMIQLRWKPPGSTLFVPIPLKNLTTN